MQLEDMQLLYDYNYWATGLMLTQAAKLTPEQLSQPTNFPWGSLQKTLIHMLDTEYGWRSICQHGLVTPDLPDTLFPTLESIVSYWQAEEAEMRAYLNSLSDEALNGLIRYDIPEGFRERVLWHCLLHVVNHGTQHRSECAAMLTEMGHSPGDIDFTLFLNQRAGIE